MNNRGGRGKRQRKGAIVRSQRKRGEKFSSEKKGGYHIIKSLLRFVILVPREEESVGKKTRTRSGVEGGTPVLEDFKKKRTMSERRHRLKRFRREGRG